MPITDIPFKTNTPPVLTTATCIAKCDYATPKKLEARARREGRLRWSRARCSGAGRRWRGGRYPVPRASQNSRPDTHKQLLLMTSHTAVRSTVLTAARHKVLNTTCCCLHNYPFSQQNVDSYGTRNYTHGVLRKQRKHNTVSPLWDSANPWQPTDVWNSTTSTWHVQWQVQYVTGRHKARLVMGAVSHVLWTIKLRTIHHHEISTDEILERLQTGTGCKPGEYRPLSLCCTNGIYACPRPTDTPTIMKSRDTRT